MSPRTATLPPPISASKDTRSTALSPSIEAKFGVEIEIPSVDVSTQATGGGMLGRGVVLLERPHWKLECDYNGGGRHDLEFVTNPLASEADVRAATREISALCEEIRNRALANDMTVRLKDLAGDTKVDCMLHIGDPRLPGRLQATYGIGLNHLGTVIDELLPTAQAKAIHADTQAVAELYAARTGAALPPGARGFVELLNMYLARAKARLSAGGTVHVFFRMMARSDFCSAFDKLLSPDEQQAVRSLLVAPKEPDNAVPMMMEALNIADPQARVFSRPYNLADPAHRLAGPAIKDWFQSIVDGRREGLFHKDLLSPPPGYPLHTGDLSKDYGMGAMGVDETNGLILFEIRGAPYRSQHIPMNGQLSRAVLNEFRQARRHNPTLQSTVDGPVKSAKYDALQAADKVYADLHNAAHTIELKVAQIDARIWKMIARELNAQVAALEEARTAIAARKNSPWAAHLSEAMQALGSAAREILRAGEPWTSVQAVIAKLEPFKDWLARCEAELWQAGAKRK